MESKAASALRYLGFRDADVRVVLAELREESAATSHRGALGVCTAQRLLREALVRLGPGRSARR